MGVGYRLNERSLGGRGTAFSLLAKPIRHCLGIKPDTGPDSERGNSPCCCLLEDSHFRHRQQSGKFLSRQCPTHAFDLICEAHFKIPTSVDPFGPGQFRWDRKYLRRSDPRGVIW